MSTLEQMQERVVKDYGRAIAKNAFGYEELETLITEVWNEAVEATKIKNKETIEYYQLRARNEAIKEERERIQEALIVGLAQYGMIAHLDEKELFITKLAPTKTDKQTEV